MPTLATAATMRPLLLDVLMPKKLEKLQLPPLQACALLEAAEAQPLGAPTSTAAASACAWPIVCNASARCRARRLPRERRLSIVVALVVVVVVAVLVADVEREHELRVIVVQHVGVGRGDGRDVAARRRRGSALEALEGQCPNHVVGMCVFVAGIFFFRRRVSNGAPYGGHSGP